MADQKQTAQATEAPEANGKKRGHPGDEVCTSAQEAIELAKGRSTGPRQAFKVKAKDGREVFRVSHNQYMAGFRQYLADGGAVDRIDEPSKGGGGRGGAKLTGVDAILAAINALPEAERAAVKAQVDAQLKGQAPPKPAPAHAGAKK